MNTPNATIRVNVDPTNPGQFFACCGLFELGNRLWPGAEGWFEAGEFRVACDGRLNEVLDALANCHMTNMMTEAQHARLVRRRSCRGESVQNVGRSSIGSRYRNFDERCFEEFRVAK